MHRPEKACLSFTKAQVLASKYHGERSLQVADCMLLKGKIFLNLGRRKEASIELLWAYGIFQEHQAYEAEREECAILLSFIFRSCEEDISLIQAAREERGEMNSDEAQELYLLETISEELVKEAGFLPELKFFMAQKGYYARRVTTFTEDTKKPSVNFSNEMLIVG
jgi:hypothetical protein